MTGVIHLARVSVVIPCYNAGDYLEEAVQSALAQNYRDLEVIVVDDGSTDERTKEILDSANWPRTTVIRQPNGGPSAARNRAVGAATGEFILPLDADDKIDPSYVEKAVAIMQAQPDVGIVYCQAHKFGVEAGAWQLPAYSINELVIDNVIFCTSLYRKDDWSRVGGYNESLRHGMEDYEFWIKLVQLGREVRRIEESLFYYRIQHSSRTTGFMADNKTVVSTYADIFRANSDFFVKHAELLFEHRFRLYDELNRYRHRYGRFERLIERHPLLKKFAKAILRLK
jgi:glycosyltransferase involved in cell wall biosynthesis